MHLTQVSGKTWQETGEKIPKHGKLVKSVNWTGRRKRRGKPTATAVKAHFSKHHQGFNLLGHKCSRDSVGNKGLEC